MNPGARTSRRPGTTAAHREELKRLQKNGTLLVNELAPRMRRESPGACREIWALKPGSEAEFLLWAGEPANSWRQFAPPSWAPREVTFSASLDAQLVNFSPSGRWLAACEGWREWRLRVWDLTTGEQVAEHHLSNPALALCFSADEDRIYVTAGVSAVILSVPTRSEAGVKKEICFDSEGASRLLAPDPGGGWLALESCGRLGLLEIGPPVRYRDMNIGGQWDVGAAFVRVVSQPEFQRKFSELKHQAPDQQSYLDELLQLQLQVSRQARQVPLERLLALRFTPDGQWLICGTSDGVRVFNWTKLVEPVARAVPCDYASEAEEPDLARDKWASRAIHCVGFDGQQKRVLFSGEEGKLNFLDLRTGRAGELLGGPERTPITCFALSDDRKIVAMTRIQGGHGNARRARFQIWNYPSLCEAAGVEF